MPKYYTYYKVLLQTQNPLSQRDMPVLLIHSIQIKTLSKIIQTLISAGHEDVRMPKLRKKRKCMAERNEYCFRINMEAKQLSADHLSFHSTMGQANEMSSELNGS